MSARREIKWRASELEPSELHEALERMRQGMRDIGRAVGEGFIAGLDTSIETTGRVRDAQSQPSDRPALPELIDHG